MKYWLYVLRKENFDITSDKKFTMVGLPERNTRSAREMEVGDKVVLYIASHISKVPGIVEIKSDYYESWDLIWDDSFPIRIKTKPYIILKKDKYIDMRELKDKLGFITNKKVWRLYFMQSIKKIDKKDYDLIEKYIIKAQKSPSNLPI